MKATPWHARPGTRSNHDRGRRGRALFLQCTNAGQYPPIINASKLLADDGWAVTILSSPNAANADISIGSHRGIVEIAAPARSRNAVRAVDYLVYVAMALAVALRIRPTLIYASDPLAALPTMLAARISGARIIYHEHDSPARGGLSSAIARWRAALAKRAMLVILPNGERGRIVQEAIGFPHERLRIVWNVPRRTDLPSLGPKSDAPLVIYYHGSITPERLPEAVVQAVRQFTGKVVLKIAGYEAPSAVGYVRELIELGGGARGRQLVEWLGQIPLREDLLRVAAQAHVGLALMPVQSVDPNMRHMTGASNKAFDYLAAGLALLVSDLEDWREMFVAPGFARTCDPNSPGSIADALNWFLDHPDQLRAMGANGRAKIEADWNYDTAFEPIMRALINDDRVVDFDA
jgi:glycosyltransferase involved in cell wall biosynthesis